MHSVLNSLEIKYSILSPECNSNDRDKQLQYSVKNTTSLGKEDQTWRLPGRDITHTVLGKMNRNLTMCM